MKFLIVDLRCLPPPRWAPRGGFNDDIPLNSNKSVRFKSEVIRSHRIWGMPQRRGQSERGAPKSVKSEKLNFNFDQQ